VVLKACSNVTITGNLFLDIPNKAISYEAANSAITITGNTFRKDNSIEGQGGRAISPRVPTGDTLSDSIIAGNVFLGAYHAIFATVYLYGLSRVQVSGNIFANQFDADGACIRIDGDNTEVDLRHNVFRNTGSLGTAKGIKTDTSTSCTNSRAIGNRYLNCVGLFTTAQAWTHRDESYDTTANRFTNAPPNRVTWAAAIPTAGTWSRGDIVYNTAPAAAGTIGWVCTTAGVPGTWKTFGAIAA
jgi:Right handed beta helix region